MVRAVSRCPLTAEAQARSQDSPYQTCDGPSGTGTGFLPVLQFSPVSSLPFHQRSTPIFIYMLLLPDGQMNEVWKPSKKQRSLANRGKWV
jgi:hypothetical protein